MLTELKVAAVKCDICGEIERLTPIRDDKNEQDWLLPIGWQRGATVDVHICPNCAVHVLHRLVKER